MSYHPSGLSPKARAKIIQTQSPVQMSPERELFSLCEIIRTEENWLTYYSKQGNIKAANRTRNFLKDKRTKLHKMIHDLFVAPNLESVTN